MVKPLTSEGDKKPQKRKRPTTAASDDDNNNNNYKPQAPQPPPWLRCCGRHVVRPISYIRGLLVATVVATQPPGRTEWQLLLRMGWRLLCGWSGIWANAVARLRGGRELSTWNEQAPPFLVQKIPNQHED
jgi:hypothetical protein